MSALLAYQASFADALARDVDDPALPAFARAPGFRVYRNTAASGLRDALAANFPTAVATLGLESFTGAALAYAREAPPADPRLALYGSDFPAFLARHSAESAAALARIDSAWSESLNAADAEPLTAAELGVLDSDAVAATRVKSHPATRWVSADASTLSAWHQHRGITVGTGPDDASALLLTRPRHAVRVTVISRADVAALDRARNRAAIADLVGAALDATPRVDIAALIARLLGAGALVFDSATGATP